MKLDQARFPMKASEEFMERVPLAARRELRPKRPSLLPELLDGLGWAAAMWVGGFLATILFVEF